MTAAMIAKTETYEEVQNLVWDTVHKFRRTYGGDLQELASTANLTFVQKVYAQYNPEKGSFTNWVRFKTWHALLEYDRVTKGTNNRCPRVYMDLTGVKSRPSRFDTEEFLNEVSEDCKIVAQIIFDTPRKFARLHRGDQSDRQGFLRSVLAGMGWSTERIAKAFCEITEAIKG